MSGRKTTRTIAVVAAASLLVGAFVAGPADARKKKKKKRKPPVVVVEQCPAYTPGAAAADVPVLQVTDAATAEAPVTVELETAAGLGMGRDATSPEGQNVSHAYQNLQIDSANPSAGLFARIEFVELEDYDLYMDTADGTNVATSAGYMAVSDGDLQNATDNDSTTAPGSEQINGYPATDCDGFTLDVVGATTPGDTVVLKLWLAEPQAVPAR